MTVSPERLAGLSPEEKRALLAELLRTKSTANTLHPLSFGQRSWWFLHQLDPDDPSCGIVFSAWIRSPLDASALRRSLQRLVDRHACLRTTYARVGSEPVQVVRPRQELALEEVDAAGWSDSLLEARVAEEADRPFDLEQGPVMRVTLFRRAERESVLLLAFHHIAADLWSLGVFLNELRRIYPAERNHADPGLPRPAMEYVDYVRVQAAMLAGPEGARLRAYWELQLAGELPVLEVPADRPRRALAGSRGRALSTRLTAELTSRLRELSQRQGATLYMTLLAVYGAWLYRATGQPEVIVGSLVATGRSRPELAGVIGFLDNPVALRLRIEADAPFAAVLARVRAVVLAAMEHQEYPFPLLVELLHPRRDPSRAPLFQTMFLLQKPHLDEEAELMALAAGGQGAQAELGGLALEPFVLERRAVTGLAGQLDLTLAIADLGRRLSVALQYNADLFEAPTIGRALSHLESLLVEWTAAPERLVGELSLLSAAERHQIAAEWNDTAERLSGELLLDRRVRLQAERTPGALAVATPRRSLTYGELLAEADRMAAHLRGLGVGPEVRVGVCIERSAEMVVALLAVLAAGGAYVPLDPAYPAERLAFLLADSGVALLLTEEALAPRLPRGAVLLSDLAARPAPAARPAAPRGERDLAYVIYTSGSTGRPKGVMIDHRSATNTLLDVNRRFGVGPEDRVLALSSLCFDLSVWDLFGALAAGAAVVVPPPSPRPDPAAWRQSMERFGVTVWNSAPALLELLVGDTLDRNARLGPGLRLALLSGDWIPVGLPDQLRGLAPRVRVHSLGGATEASIWSITYPIREVDPAWTSIPYGRPQANQRFSVLDRRLCPVPIGVPGELCIGGEGVARGYLARPDLTAARFVPDPWSGSPGGRLYRTGDLGRYLPDGTLEFLGRLDDQVKIRGFRVEPGEVEALLAQAHGVRECLVLARPDASGKKALVAYVLAEGGAAPSAADLRRYLRERLPEFMVPAAFVAVEAWPLSPSGKIDRRALPAPAATPEGDGPAPENPAEELLAAVFADVLGRAAVGVDESFFDLGGHSLQATQVMSRVRDLFRVDLPLRVLFERQTVATLAQAVAEAARGEGAGPPPIERREHGPRPPLSFAQERLCFVEQLEPGTPAYSMPAAVRVRGPLDVLAWRRALEEIVRRHPPLRARFGWEGGVAFQTLAPAGPVPVPEVDLAGLPPEAREAEAERLVREGGRQPFDLARGPLLRVRLLRLAPEEHVSLFELHHIAVDGWSIGVLVRELAALYEADRAGRSPALAELPVQYADFAAWQRSWLQGKALAAELRFWRRRLGAHPQPAELPTDRPRPAVRSYRGAYHGFPLPPGLVDDLRALGRREGATLFMTLLAGVVLLLGRHTGAEQVSVGSDIANRHRSEIEGLIGCFVNLLVMRTDLAGEPTVRQLLARVRETALEAYAHQDLPFDRLVEDLAPGRSLGRNPLFQLLFVLHNAPMPELRFGGLELAPCGIDPGITRFDLLLMVQETAGGFVATWNYDTELFTPETVERLSAHWLNLLGGMVAAPDAPVQQIEMLTAAEREEQARQRQERLESAAGRLRGIRRRGLVLEGAE